MPLHPTIQDIQDFMKFMQESSVSKRVWVIEVKVICKLKLLAAAPTAVKERSFSALKSLKTYLRSSTGNTHLENFIVLYIHQNFTDKLHLVNLVKNYL